MTAPVVGNTNVMAVSENALELSDDLVAQAHKEFEATQAKLAAFEQQERQLALYVYVYLMKIPFQVD